NRAACAGCSARSILLRDHEADAVIENQLAAMPARQADKNCREQRQHQAMRQDRGCLGEADRPVQSHERNEHHGGNRMGPACRADADSGHQQQFGRADQAGGDAAGKAESGRPQSGAPPERVGAPPVEHVAAEHPDDQGDREVHAHGMERGSGDGNGRGHRLVGDFLDNRIVRLVAGFGHGRAPSVPIRRKGRDWFRRTGLLMPLPLAAGCAGPLSVLEPEGPAARGAATLWWWMLAGSAILFAAVIALLALALVRPGALRGFGVARTLLWGGLLVPAAVLTALIVAAFALGEGMLARPLDPPALRIEAEARQW